VALALVCIAGCCGDPSRPPSGQAGPAGVGSGGQPRLEKIGDFDQPVYVTQAPGSDDLYVVEKGGTVRIVRDGKVESGSALDIRAEVATESEQGLLSVAFAPDFRDSRLAYAYYTSKDGNQNVVEYAVGDDGAFDSSSRREVLRMDDFAANHNGGLLMFGPDGHLYIGTGDGGVADDPRRNGQDLGSPLGKLLRIDPASGEGLPYGIPADNPFVDTPGARPEIYSYGLRNPWRYSFDRRTGALVIGDVGQGTLEEVDYVPDGGGRGANFGWSAFEGNDRFNLDQQAPNAVAPVLTYGRDDGCSVTGGYVVRDPALPALEGRYLYGDFCNPSLRTFLPAKHGARDDRPLGLEVPELSSFGQDDQGRIYATSLAGPVFRLVQ
jgi:glucose/arabinose dehydrogenase